MTAKEMSELIAEAHRLCDGVVSVYYSPEEGYNVDGYNSTYIYDAEFDDSPEFIEDITRAILADT